MGAEAISAQFWNFMHHGTSAELVTVHERVKRLFGSTAPWMTLEARYAFYCVFMTYVFRLARPQASAS